MLKFLSLFTATCFCFSSPAQEAAKGWLKLNVVNEQQKPVAQATAELWRTADSSLVKAQLTDSLGRLSFGPLEPGLYRLRISAAGFRPFASDPLSITNAAGVQLPDVLLHTADVQLAGVTVSARKPFIELRADKTVVNLDAGITNAGTTALEALEKLPGVSVDRDGNISLKGKPGVLVLIDDKPTYVGGSELATLLGGMSAAQVSQIELMDHPPARYDAAGNAGIINIKTKKNRQRGFNGTATLAYGQGQYAKNNGSLLLNYQNGKFNLFGNYSLNANENFTRLYALRSYLEPDGQTIGALLEQPTFIKGQGHTHTLRAGVDYLMNPKTTIGLSLTGVALSRESRNTANAIWMQPGGPADSVILTETMNGNKWRNGGINLNLRHAFPAAGEFTVNMDLLGYRIRGSQFSSNRLARPAGFAEAIRGNLPSDLRILSAKADYSRRIGTVQAEGGWKSSRITTDNLAAYEYGEGAGWKTDLGKSNHFLYTEELHALYGNVQSKAGKWSLQGGLRYELTHYDAVQKGNVVQKDSSFSRSYGSFFPTTYITYQADSLNAFTLHAGRRIDRPAYQKLNPFVFIINKYTYQKGNPYLQPQYTWNMALSHQFRDLLVTSLDYSIIRNYFSQLFLTDTSGIMIYTEGNLSRMQNLGLSMSVQLTPLNWWSLSGQAGVQHKKIEGRVGRIHSASITQMSFNLSNQLRFPRGWSGELTGFYNTRSQQDLQEIVDPAGQVSAGIAKTVLKNKGTVKMGVRDIFYTQAMKGITYFEDADEYFSLTRDTRVFTLSFTYRFGKATRSGARTSPGAAREEVERVGSGN